MVIGANYSAFKSLFANSDGMTEGAEYIENTFLKTLTEFIGKKPEYVSIVSFNVNDQIRIFMVRKLLEPWGRLEISFYSSNMNAKWMKSTKSKHCC